MSFDAGNEIHLYFLVCAFPYIILNFISSKLHLLHHVVHLICVNNTRTSVLFRHTFRNTFFGVVGRGAALLFKLGWMVIHQPCEMFRTRVNLTIPTRVLESQSHPNLARIHVVFETRTNPHRHRMLLVSRFVAPSLSIFGVWCVFMYIVFLIGEVPSSIEHLANFQLDLDHMLVARHLRNLTGNQ